MRTSAGARTSLPAIAGSSWVCLAVWPSGRTLGSEAPSLVFSKGGGRFSSRFTPEFRNPFLLLEFLVLSFN